MTGFPLARPASGPGAKGARGLPVAVLIGLALGVTGCRASAPELILAPLSEMPSEVRPAPSVVQEAYRFAAANPEVLRQLPCYCGCGAMGHASNYACYSQASPAGGAPTFDPHALGCSICIDITQDAMRLLRQGETVEEIRTFIDNHYSRYGPSNMQPAAQTQ